MKKRRLYKFISTHDAKIIEELYSKCLPSDSEKIFVLFKLLEGDLAQQVVWRMYGSVIKSYLMREEE